MEVPKATSAASQVATSAAPMVTLLNETQTNPEPERIAASVANLVNESQSNREPERIAVDKDPNLGAPSGAQLLGIGLTSNLPTASASSGGGGQQLMTTAIGLGSNAAQEQLVLAPLALLSNNPFANQFTNAMLLNLMHSSNGQFEANQKIGAFAFEHYQRNEALFRQQDQNRLMMMMMMLMNNQQHNGGRGGR